MVKIVSIFKEMLVLCKILQSFFSIFLFNLPSQCFTCITKRMMEMDGDSENCVYFQRKAHALERYCAVIPNLEKHAVISSRTMTIQCFQQSNNAHAFFLVKTRTRSINPKRARDIVNYNK